MRSFARLSCWCWRCRRSEASGIPCATPMERDFRTHHSSDFPSIGGATRYSASSSVGCLSAVWPLAPRFGCRRIRRRPSGRSCFSAACFLAFSSASFPSTLSTVGTSNRPNRAIELTATGDVRPRFLWLRPFLPMRYALPVAAAHLVLVSHCASSPFYRCIPGNLRLCLCPERHRHPARDPLAVGEPLLRPIHASSHIHTRRHVGGGNGEWHRE